jgi:hypothetical protein
MILAVVISLLDPKPVVAGPVDKAAMPVTTPRVKKVWLALVIAMVILYIIFN